MALTKTAVEPLLGFITKVTAVRVAAAANPANARPIREQVCTAAGGRMGARSWGVGVGFDGCLPRTAGRGTWIHASACTISNL